MKRTANIAILSLSVLIILIMPLVPHHHHGGVECMVMERCVSDNTYNDEHTAHHNGGSKDNSACVRNIHSLKAQSGNYWDYGTVRLFLLPNLVCYEPLACFRLRKECLCDGYSIFYKSPAGRGTDSPRPPPCLYS